MITKLNLKAFTLLESLLTLFIASFLVISLSGSIQGVFQDVEERLFFLSFEHLYRDSQQLSLAQKSDVTLSVTASGIRNSNADLAIPTSVSLLDEKIINFDAKGGNSSLTKVRFATDDGIVTYQLYLGSGKYQKTTT
ncbi:competence type IV pilus minor pilin ComGD [Streptococcus porci]|uniref:competence type IV pilus minor pilin ComGD n=1 Tax=Streptococcus porci TaxID=502567 RepID=UPI0003F5E0A5|nr:competence type IV pilus minor pilin ComGD [Streptococcus porci]